MSIKQATLSALPSNGLPSKDADRLSTNGAHDLGLAPNSNTLAVLDHSGDEWSAQPSSVSDEENYDELEYDRSAVVGGSKGGGIEKQEITIAPQEANGEQAKTSGAQNRPLHSRRQSIQVVLEKTSKKGRYLLQADDPEVWEIIRSSIAREAAGSDADKKSRTRFRDLVFTRRFTTFDRQNPLGSESPFHGFFTLFWIAVGLLLVKVALQNWKMYGSVLGRAEIMHMMYERDLLILGLADGAMCGSTVFGLVLQRVIKMGYLSWANSGWIIQNVWQSLWLFAVVGFTWYREWPWTHTIFFVLHGLIFLMKQHSYAFYNGYLSQVYRRRRILEQKLEQLDSMDPVLSHSADSSPVQNHSASATAVDPAIASTGNSRNRRPSLGSKATTNLAAEESEISSIASAIDSGEALDEHQMHAFGRVMRAEIRSLTEELNGKCTDGANAYPKSLTLANWADWLCLPTLVYELEYPRQEKINWWYVGEKTAATFGIIWCMLVISQAYIYPSVTETLRMKEEGMSLAERCREFPFILSDMLFPLLLEQLLSWYVIWECCLNVIAEVTRFADRGFYGDWWNSTSWDQYARDWNRPVHNFLLRHVYHSSISAFHLSKSTATFVTFLLSACVHELIMLCLFKKVRGYLFMMQLMQVPLVTLSRTKLLKGRSILGNCVFWFGLFVGPSLLTSLYLIV